MISTRFGRAKTGNHATTVQVRKYGYSIFKHTVARACHSWFLLYPSARPQSLGTGEPLTCWDGRQRPPTGRCALAPLPRHQPLCRVRGTPRPCWSQIHAWPSPRTPVQACLVAGAETRAVVTVEVLIEQDEIAPGRVLLKLPRASVHRPPASLIFQENASQPVRDLLRHLVQVHLPPRARKTFRR